MAGCVMVDGLPVLSTFCSDDLFYIYGGSCIAFDLDRNLRNAGPTVYLPDAARELALYESVAQALARSTEVTTIAAKIEEYMQLTTDDGVFMVVEAPSGSGKSQVPFVLRAMGLNTIHLVMERFRSEKLNQPIYRTLKAPSQGKHSSSMRRSSISTTAPTTTMRSVDWGC